MCLCNRALAWTVRSDNRRHKPRSFVLPDELVLAGLPPPVEQLAGRETMTTSRRRYHARRTETLRNDPLLLFQRPAAARSCLDHLKRRDFRHRRMTRHTPISSPPHPHLQGGRSRRTTIKELLRAIMTVEMEQRQSTLYDAVQIRRLRVEVRKTSVSEVAQKIGCDPSNLMKVLNGTRSLSADLEQHVARRFGATDPLHG